MRDTETLNELAYLLTHFWRVILSLQEVESINRRSMCICKLVIYIKMNRATLYLKYNAAHRNYDVNKLKHTTSFLFDKLSALPPYSMIQHYFVDYCICS